MPHTSKAKKPGELLRASCILFWVSDHKTLVLLKNIYIIGISRANGLDNTGTAALSNLSKPWVKCMGERILLNHLESMYYDKTSWSLNEARKKQIFIAKTTLPIKFWHINLTLLFASALDFQTDAVYAFPKTSWIHIQFLLSPLDFLM